MFVFLFDLPLQTFMVKAKDVTMSAEAEVNGLCLYTINNNV